MHRMGLPGTEEERKRSEFFKGSLAEAKRALKAIGRGDYFEFESNDISKMRKQTLTRGDEIETTQVKLRESPRLLASKLSNYLRRMIRPRSKRSKRCRKLSVSPPD